MFHGGTARNNIKTPENPKSNHILKHNPNPNERKENQALKETQLSLKTSRRICANAMAWMSFSLPRILCPFSLGIGYWR